MQAASLCTLLIVPYGIETRPVFAEKRIECRLLIVPYGIETRVKLMVVLRGFLLIVPYGIETAY